MVSFLLYQRFVDEALNHADLELLRPQIPIVATKPENVTASIVEAKKESCAAIPSAQDVPIAASNADGAPLCEAAPAVKAAEICAERVDPSVDNGQRAQTQSVVDGEPSGAAQTAPRCKESGAAAAETRASTVVKEEHDATSLGVTGGTMSATSASPSAAANQSDVNVHDASRTEQTAPAPFVAPSVVVSTPTHSLPGAAAGVPAPEPPVKPPKTPGAGRGSKQQLTLAPAVEIAAVPAVGRGRGAGSLSAAVGRPPAPPSPAALSPATAVGEGEEEVVFSGIRARPGPVH
jgi:hypothetical protein